MARDGEIAVTTSPLMDSAGVVTLAIDDDPVDPEDPRLFHKTDDRGRYDDRLARYPEVDDLVLVNRRGEATETTIANLMVRLDGAWYTPPLDSGCLPGIYREVALESGRVTERVITLDDLGRAEELAVANSVRLWCPARLAG